MKITNISVCRYQGRPEVNIRVFIAFMVNSDKKAEFWGITGVNDLRKFSPTYFHWKIFSFISLPFATGNLILALLLSRLPL